MTKKSTTKTAEVVAVDETKLAKVEDKEVGIDFLLKRAIDGKTPVEVVEKLLEMMHTLNAEFAKKQFDGAMSEFQAECPTIKKTKEVKNRQGEIIYSYAPLENIVGQVGELIKKHGFSYSAKMRKTDFGVLMTIVVKHIDGHQEESEMEIPLGNKTQVMSDSQVVASASTFAKRYAFCNAFGILTGDEDNDGAVVAGTGEVVAQPAQPVRAENNNNLFERATEMIKKATDHIALQDLKAKVQGSEKYNIGQKQVLVNTIDARLSELLKPEAEKFEQNAGGY